MPNSSTFRIPPIRDFVQKYIDKADTIIDPFHGDNPFVNDIEYTNDLNPKFPTRSNLKAIEFLCDLENDGIRADLGLFDPPYSLRQTKECYDGIGVEMVQEETTNGYWKRERILLSELIRPGGIVLSFGWNSIGMGIDNGFEPIEILLVCHGGAHNDTICKAERKIPQQELFT